MSETHSTCHAENSRSTHGIEVQAGLKLIGFEIFERKRQWLKAPKMFVK